MPEQADANGLRSDKQIEERAREIRIMAIQHQIEKHKKAIAYHTLELRCNEAELAMYTKES